MSILVKTNKCFDEDSVHFAILFFISIPFGMELKSKIDSFFLGTSLASLIGEDSCVNVLMLFSSLLLLSLELSIKSCSISC